jgi:hypothetical protein
MSQTQAYKSFLAQFATAGSVGQSIMQNKASSEMSHIPEPTEKIICIVLGLQLMFACPGWYAG